MLAPERIFEASGQGAARLAIRARDGSLQYHQLLRRSLQLGALLNRRVSPGTLVAVVGGDDLATYASLLGVWFAGCAYVPLSRSNPASRNVRVLRGASPGLVLSSEPHQPVIDAASACGVELCLADASQSMPPLDAPIAPKASDLAYVLFTSGSTGAPKGVSITHGNLAAFLDSWQADPNCELEPEDIFLQMFDLGFDLSVMSFVAPLSIGASFHVVPQRGVSYLNIARTLVEGRVSVSMMVPSVLSYLRRFFGELQLPHLRYSMFAGEALPQSLVEEWSRCVPNAVIQNSYGPTEATIICTIYDWELERSKVESEDGVVPIGLPMATNNVVVVDESGAEVADEVEGELCVYGPQVMAGYWKDTERTDAAFLDVVGSSGPTRAYRTGDLVSRAPSGVLRWHMRKDFQVKIDGHRIELGEIEARARELLDTTQVVAMTVPDADGQHMIALFYAGSERSEDDFRGGLTGVLPDYMQPRMVRVLPELPLTSSGKIDRSRLGRLLDGG